MENSSDITTRPASREDGEFIISLLPRLTEFGIPTWRDRVQMINTDIQILTGKLKDEPKNTAIFIAQDSEKNPLGFIHLQTGYDYYNKEKHGHISDLIVSPDAEGRGIGSLLIAKAEEWARSKGYSWLTLSVFAENVRAKRIYEQLGFEKDIIKYVKPLT